jgi:hypothetical protein
MSRWQFFASLALACASFCVASGSVLGQRATGPKAADDDPLAKLDPYVADATKPDPNDSPLRKLQKERCRERAAALLKLQRAPEINGSNSADFYESLKLPVVLSENLLDLADKPADRVKCHELRLAWLKDAEKRTESRLKLGFDPPHYHNLARAAALDAEIALMKFKAEAEKK